MDKPFSNTSVNEKVYIFSHNILSILSNFISHEYIMCDDIDPPWYNSKIKHLTQEKNNVDQLYWNNKGNTCFRNRLNFLQGCLKNLTEMSKQKYCPRIAKKLTMTRKRSKTYWSLWKLFLNNKKIPIESSLSWKQIFDRFQGKGGTFQYIFC